MEILAQAFGALLNLGGAVTELCATIRCRFHAVCDRLKLIKDGLRVDGRHLVMPVSLISLAAEAVSFEAI